MIQAASTTAQHNANTLAMFEIKNSLHQKIITLGVRCVDKFHDFQDLASIEEERLFMLYTQDPLHNKSKWQQINQLLDRHSKKLLVYTDNFLTDLKFSNIVFHSHPSLIGVNCLHVDFQSYPSSSSNHPTRKFNCFMQRIDPVRQSWFYFLYNRNLIDQGYVSFRLWQVPNSNLPCGKELFDHIHQTANLGALAHFETAYQALRDQVPYANFVENNILVDKILDSKYSLVSDTAATEDDQGFCFVSEKAYRALMTPTLDLLFLQRGTLEELQKLGIESSSQFLGFDHLSWHERQQCILDILVQDPLSYNYKVLRERSQHNQNVLERLWDTLPDLSEQVLDTLNSVDIVG